MGNDFSGQPRELAQSIDSSSIVEPPLHVLVSRTEGVPEPAVASGDSQDPPGVDGSSETAGDGRNTGADDKRVGWESYNQQQVVRIYTERLEPELESMEHVFEAMGESDFQWQTEVIISIVVTGQPDLAFRLFVETQDLRKKLLERRELEAEQLERGGGGGSTTATTSTSSVDTTMASDMQSKKKAWDRLVDTFMAKIDPDILKLIAHLGAVREWSVSGEVSANAFFVKGKMGLSITFGD